MVTVPSSLRIMLLKHIPDLTSIELNRYENFLATRQELIQQARINAAVQVEGYPPFSKRQWDLIKQIEVTSGRASTTIRPYSRRFFALLDLWSARQRVGAQMGYLHQIPTTREGLRNLITAIIDHQKVQIRTYAILLTEAVKDIFRDKKCIPKSPPESGRDPGGRIA